MPDGSSLPLPPASFQVLPGAWSCLPHLLRAVQLLGGLAVKYLPWRMPRPSQGWEPDLHTGGKKNVYEMVDHGSSELGQVDASLEIREDFWEEVTPEP